MDLNQVAINRDFRPVFEEMAENKGAPLWVELLPPGELIEGRDGRSWANSNPQAIVDAFEANGADLPVDIEHSTELKAPEGDPAPAVGWIKGLEVREDGAIYGLVDWNDDGRWMIESKQYRYISPVFIYNAKTSSIVRLTSVGLTNNPNLQLTALNQRELNGEPEAMKELLKALGLSADATEAQALNALQELKNDHDKALNTAKTPSLDKFVPTADYDKAVNRAETAEEALKEKVAADQEGLIETAINSALKAGKIVPATADYHRAACREEGGLDRFNDFVEKSPVIAGDPNLDDKGQNKDANSVQLTAEDKAVCASTGMSEEDFLEHKKSLFSEND
jgi:phage I-like protein